MVSLFIDATSNNLVVALLNKNIIVEMIKLESIRTHNLYLLDSIDKILNNNNYSLCDIKKIYVASGPGSFTGTRIGITVAKTLAFSLKTDICRISSLKLPIFTYKNYDYYITILKDNKNLSYIGIYDKSYNTIEEKLINNNEIELITKKYNNIKLIDNCDSYNIEDALNHYSNITENVHLINPNYIKEVI